MQVDDVACFDQMGCHSTPGLHHQNYSPLKIFLNDQNKYHIKHLFCPEILDRLENYETLPKYNGAQDKTSAKSFNSFGLMV